MLNEQFLLEKRLKDGRIPISIGVAPTKTLAKVANHIAKKYTKNGVFILNNNNLQRILNIFPVEDLGELVLNMLRNLITLYLYSLQFRDLDTDWIKRNFSINGVRLQDELKGIKHYSIESVLPRKNYMYNSFFWARNTRLYDIKRGN